MGYSELMNHTLLPKQCDQYEWIAKRFSKVPGVEAVLMNVSTDGVDMVLTNAKAGKQKKIFTFPLRRLFFVDYHVSGETPNPYDIMEIDEPKAMVELGYAKAYQFFKD